MTEFTQQTASDIHVLTEQFRAILESQQSSERTMHDLLMKMNSEIDVMSGNLTSINRTLEKQEAVNAIVQELRTEISNVKRDIVTDAEREKTKNEADRRRIDAIHKYLIAIIGGVFVLVAAVVTDYLSHVWK